MEPLWLITAALGSFLLGSIPFGAIIARARGIDIRQHGSKNIGATNVWRVLGPRAGLLCFTLDFLKGLLPALVVGWLMGLLGDLDARPAPQAAWLAVGLCAVLGHMFSPWVGFKGGKGVATGFGVVMGFFPWLTFPGVLALLVWVATLKVSGYVSLSSIFASLALILSAPAVYPVARALGVAQPGPVSPALPGWPFALAALALGLMVIVRHRANIARLRAGTELKAGHAKRAAGPSA